MIKTDTLIKSEGMKALSDKLGLVDAERFVSLINRERFDYTEWQRGLFEDMTLEELCQKADESWRNTYPN